MFITNGVVFSHIKKTGGTSIHNVMRKHCKCALLGQLHAPDKGTNHIENHYLAQYDPSTLKTYFGKSLEEFWVFTIIRNPWARYVSWFAWSKPGRLNKESFNERLITVLEDTPKAPNRRLTRQSDFFDEPSVFDFVASTENLDNDWLVIREKLGLPTVELGQANRSNHEHYSLYYTNRTRNLVANEERRLIDLFGYEFEDER